MDMRPARLLRAMLLAVAVAVCLSAPFASAAPASQSAGCSGEMSMEVPAVMGDGGGLVNVTMRLAEGGGSTYATVSPKVGMQAQESVERAVRYGRALAHGDDGCDVLVDFGANPSTSYIDGPSAGAAMTVMSYSLFGGLAMRDDTVITGTVEEGGAVGPVGGLYEKAKSAAASGAEYFIAPAGGIYDRIMLGRAGERYGIQVIEAASVEDVAGFMTENRSIDQEKLAVRGREVPDVPEYEDAAGLEPFRKIAGDMIVLERGRVESLPENAAGGDGNGGAAGIGEIGAVRGYFEDEIMRQEGIIEKGYFFSAANEAFLDYIELDTVNALVMGEPDLARKKGESGICLGNVRRPAMTTENFEWVAGADQRLGWAYDRIEGTDISGRMIEDERFAAYNELAYADAWCRVAGGLAAAAPAGGVQLDEGAWGAIASRRIAEARALNATDGEYTGRIRIAQSNYDAGRFGAAIFDAVWVAANVEADAGAPAGADIGAIADEGRSSLWGRVYQSHAAFLAAQNQSAGAYRAALFARGLDEAVAEMNASAMPRAGAGPGPADGAGDSLDPRGPGLLTPAAAACASMFIFIIVVILLARRTNGDHGTGPGKAYRIEQEEGGTPVPGKGPGSKP